MDLFDTFSSFRGIFKVGISGKDYIVHFTNDTLNTEKPKDIDNLEISLASINNFELYKSSEGLEGYTPIKVKLKDIGDCRKVKTL